MIRYGKAPFLECSSKGDRRFSALFASVNGMCIEQQYQEAKVFADGRPRSLWDAKGLHAVNQDEVRALYSELWDQYIAEHIELVAVLLAAQGLQDTFGQPGHACQAAELWRIRREWSNKLCCGLFSPLFGPEPPSTHWDNSVC
jgi:hypothetical protein